MAAMKPRVRDDLEMIEIDGEIVVYDPGTRSLHHLNPTATVVLSQLDGSATVKEVARDLAAAYQVPADEMQRQIRVLIRQFRHMGLLRGGKGDGG